MSDTQVTPEAIPAGDAPEATPPQETFSADYVKELRDEAAAARIAKKTAVDAAKAEVIKDYEGKLAGKDTAFAELQSTHTTTSTELLKLQAILADDDFAKEDVLKVAELVAGSDEETISESIKRVKAIYGGKAPANDRLVDPSQGSGSHIPLNGDPILNMIKSAVGAR